MIVEDPEHACVFVMRCLPHNRKIIFRYGNNMESTFHVREGDGNCEPATTATPRIVPINAIVEHGAMCSKARLSTIGVTSKTIALQDGPIQHVPTQNMEEDDPASSKFLTRYDRRRNAILKHVKLPGTVDGGGSSNNVLGFLPAWHALLVAQNVHNDLNY